jgi:hypothetical protein
LGQQLVRRRLALHVDRLNKKPLPNSKKLVKFPRKLTLLPPDQAAVSGSARRVPPSIATAGQAPAQRGSARAAAVGLLSAAHPLPRTASPSPCFTTLAGFCGGGLLYLAV